MKKTLIFILLLLAAMSSNAQSVTYAYDNAGNRTERVITLTKSPAAPQTPKKATTLADRIAEKTILIYPNPTKGILSVEIKNFTDQMQAGFRLMDMSGKTISSKIAVSDHQTFDLSRQATGIYLLQITIDGESTVWKIIKE